MALSLAYRDMGGNPGGFELGVPNPPACAGLREADSAPFSGIRGNMAALARKYPTRRRDLDPIHFNRNIMHLTERRKVGSKDPMMEEVTIGRRGSITLPAKMRKQYGLQERDKLIVEEIDQGLLLRPAVSMPIELYSEERITEFNWDAPAIGKMLDDLNSDKP